MRVKRLIPHSRPTLGSAETHAIAKVLKSGQIAQGPVVEAFEKEMADWMNLNGAVAVNSGTSALHLGLVAMGIGKGDEVLLPSYVCTALLNAIRYTGATARLVDIDPDSFNIDPVKVKQSLTRRSRAIIVPHLFGLPADMRQLQSLGIPIIEDCAQCLGVPYRGQSVGTFGVFSMVSFYATKLITTGEGGMVLSRSRPFLEKIRALREYDQKRDRGLAFNYKMTDMQAALGRTQLKRLPALLRKRKALAKRYDEALSSIPIKSPGKKPDRGHCYYRYVVQVKGPVQPFLRWFHKNGISCERPVFRPLHQYLGQGGFSETDRVHRHALSLPLYPSLSEKEVRSILSKAVKVFG